MEYNTRRRKSIKEHKEEAEKNKPVLVHVILILIILASLSMCVQQTYQLFLLYLKDPIETEIKMHINDVMEFPAVTVCNMNPVRSSRWNKQIKKFENEEAKQLPLSVKLHKKAKTTNIHGQTKSRWVARNQNKTMDQLNRDMFRKTKRTKRQDWDLYLLLRSVGSIVVNNKNALDSLETTISDLEAKDRSISMAINNTRNIDLVEIENELKKVFSSPLESIVKNLEKRIGSVQLNMSEFLKEMEKTRNYLTSLQTNMTAMTNVTANGTSEERKELPPSKDTEAFNDYLRNIGKMTKADIQALGHQKEDFIAICSWQGTICNPSHFNVFQDILYGNCFTFNTSQIEPIVKGTGPRNGLSLSLYIEQNEYIDRVAPAAGARIVIHNFDQKPFPEDEGFSIAAGHTTSVYLRKTTTETVKPMCDPDIAANTYQHNGKTHQYSQKACIKLCLSDEILRKCHCAGVQFLLDNEKRCSLNNQEEETCVERLEGLAKKNELPCSCPASCRTTTYNTMVSSAIWPAEKYLSSFIEELGRVNHKVVNILQNVTDLPRFFTDNFLRVDIFFNELTEQEIIERHSYGVKDLISDIGGQLGLWIGVSVATLYESTKTISAFFAFVVRSLKARKRGRRLRPFNSPTIKVGMSYQVASSNSLTPHWTLATAASRTSSKFLHVHFEMDTPPSNV